MSALDDTPQIAIGDLLDGKYQITEILGEGAMGVVYLALHKRLQRTVALKTLRAELATDAELVARFEQEARAASAIGHPNIVQVFDAGGDAGGTPYLVMEYLEGQSLGDLLHEEGQLDIERSIDICCQVLAGLGAAHSAGILHRDLKPDNIFITKDAEGQEVAKILDFGISKILDIADPSLAGDSRATRIGAVLGTPLYMSPEQAVGRADLDLRADLWAAVCVLYECVSGKTPFNGENYNQILAAVVQGIFVGLRQHRPDVPEALHELVERGLKKERDDRFPDATSLSVALTSIVSNMKDQGATQVEPNMLAGFDNIADKFLEQERQESASMHLPAPTAASPALTPPPAASKSSPGPALDPFAPPDSQAVLSLELDTDPAAPGAKAAQEKRAPAPRPKKRAREQQITREEPSNTAAFVGKSLLAIVIVAAAGAGYRYHKLGYILPSGAPTLATLTLTVEPEDAEVTLNDEQISDRTLELEDGKRYALQLRSANRLLMTGQFEAHNGDKIRVSESMWHKLLKIDSAIVAEVKAFDTEPEDAASLAATLEKFDAYGDCGARLAGAIEKVAEAKELDALPRPLTDECIATFDLAITAEPAIEALDLQSTKFRESLASFGQAIVEQERSKGGGAKIRRARSQQARAAFREMKSASAAWATVMSNKKALWHHLEAQRALASTGDPLHSDVRALAVASDAWMRTHLAGKGAKKQRAAMMEHFAILSKSAGHRTEEYKERGITGYINALRPLIDKDPGEDALFWHNQSVEVFNKIRLPILLAVDSADP